MTYYMIHTYPKRLWYVQEYLIPSLLKQGIKEEQIIVYNDDKKEGNLLACLSSFSLCSNYVDKCEGIWHLQDDVIICKDFKIRTEMYDKGIVCGFSSRRYDGDRRDKKGQVVREKMWFSFPCIRIPNKYAIECSIFVKENIIGNPVYEKFWKSGRNDDWAFRKFLEIKYPKCTAINLCPNLVDHIDYLIGGGSGGKRKVIVNSQYFKDKYIVDMFKREMIEKGIYKEETLEEFDKNKKKKRITYQDEDVYV